MDAANQDEILVRLTDQERGFLKRHGIEAHEVFDAAGFSQPDYRSQMSLHEKTIAINVTPCGRFGHTMRTGGGHCAQCNPAALAFQKRYRQKAYVYIAGSKGQRILKVGFSEQPNAREAILNSLRYGSASDWTLLFHVRCKRAGSVEGSLLVLHRDSSVFGDYWKGTKYQRCLELLRCNYSALRASIETLLDIETMLGAWEHVAAATDFNFGAKDLAR